MNYLKILVILLVLATNTMAQDLFGLDKLQLKSNEFTEYVMSQGLTLNEKLPINLVPAEIEDFKLQGQDSLAMVRIRVKSFEYYDYLVDYQNKSGITTLNLASIFLESANETSNDSDCFKDWYITEAQTIAVTLTCYQLDIASVKESCIARSIQATIINNSNVAECFKELESK